MATISLRDKYKLSYIHCTIEKEQKTSTEIWATQCVIIKKETQDLFYCQEKCEILDNGQLRMSELSV